MIMKHGVIGGVRTVKPRRKKINKTPKGVRILPPAKPINMIVPDEVEEIEVIEIHLEPVIALNIDSLIDPVDPAEDIITEDEIIKYVREVESKQKKKRKYTKRKKKKKATATS